MCHSLLCCVVSSVRVLGGCGAAYERSHPVVDFELIDDGPVHLVVGGAGNREGHAGVTDQSLNQRTSVFRCRAFGSDTCTMLPTPCPGFRTIKFFLFVFSNENAFQKFKVA